MNNPECFYIPKRSEDQYSKQELLFLELIRERMCTDVGTDPVCPLVYVRDEQDEPQDDDVREGSWEVAVKNRIADLRRVRAEKKSQQ